MKKKRRIRSASTLNSNIICFGQMFKLAFVPNFPRIPHPREERGKFLLTSSGELFKPRFRRCTPIRSQVELDSQDRTVTNLLDELAMPTPDDVK